MISLQSATLYQGPQCLLSEASLTIYQGQKLGVIGRNGCGKTSLFSVLMQQHALDGGELLLPDSLRRAQMRQETEASERSALDYVLDGHQDYRRLQAAQQQAEARDDMQALANLSAELDALQAWELPNLAERLLSGLGFSTAEFSKPVSAFSGGWRIRLNLAQALLQPSDLLLLDEPTNHLDLEAELWLQQWLQRYPGTLLLISHDRRFLDEVVDGIVSFEGGKLISYTGNYSSYERQKAERLAQQQAAFAKQQQRKSEIENFVRRFRAKASKAKQAQSRLKELQRMVDIEPAHVDSPFQFRFPAPARQPETLLTLESLAVGYAEPLFQGLSMTISAGERIGLLGPNGQGKSTLLKTLVGQLAPLAGKLHPSDHLRLGYCAQHQVDALEQQASPLELLRKLDPRAEEQQLRNFLGSFDFRGERVEAPIAPFSGGEKSRLALALVAWLKPNLLLLDEPTNHLDLEMVHALTRALQDYEGALVLVSHDRHLLNNTVDRFLLLKDGKVDFFEGSLDDYEQLLLQKPEQGGGTGNAKGLNQRQLAARQREQLKPLKDKVRQLEKQLEREHGRLQQMEAELADSSLYEESRKTELAQLLKAQGELKQQLESTELAWLEAQEALEQAAAGAA